MMSDIDDDERKVISDWHKILQKGTDFDSWGQPVEAIEIYAKLAVVLRSQGTPDASTLTDQQKKVVNKVAACLETRTKDLQLHRSAGSVGFSELKKVEEQFVSLVLSANSREFPVDVSGAVHSPSRADSTEHYSETGSQHSKFSEDHEEIPSADEIVDQRTRSSILPPPACPPGHTILAVRIEKIGLKDSSNFLDPFITVSVKDANGREVTAIQDTAVAGNKDDTAVYFGTDLYIQKSIECLPEGFGIFFEFKHYKPRKKSISTRCWSFLEKDELKEGQVVTELYKKPTDVRRKKINLLTVKPLYLHLKLSLIN